MSNFPTYSATPCALRLVWPPWTLSLLLAHRVNVCDLSGQGFCISPCSAFHITKLWASSSSLVDCNFVMWVLGIAGVDSIRNFQEKKLQSWPAGGLRPSVAITLALTQIPSHSNTAFPSPVRIPSFLHPPFLFFSVHAYLMISSAGLV